MLKKFCLIAGLALVGCTDDEGGPTMPGPDPTLTLSADSISLMVGANTTLSATIANSTAPAVFVSRDETVATVSSAGVIAGVKAGRTVIAASLSGQAQIRDSVIVVVAAPVGPSQPKVLPLLGTGSVTERYTAEVAVSGNIAYTTTWNRRLAPGNALKIWNVAGNTPVLLDSVIVANAGTLSDVQISADGALLVVSVEGGGSAGNGIIIYDRSNPTRLTQLSRYIAANTSSGVHTVKLSRINNRHYAFLQINSPARLSIVDITVPAAPVEVFTQLMGEPTLHDVFVRDGILFTALWDGGMSIFDVGGANRGGSPSAPVLLGNVKTVGGNVHNIWWYHDPRTGEKKYAFVGEESPGNIGGFQSSAGDVHVVDVSSNFASPREVAFYHVQNETTSTSQSAGAHNFVVDEPSGIMYAAFYNGGVRALDVRGDLSACTATQRSVDGRCDLRLMGREVGVAVSSGGHKYVWGVAINGNFLYASDMINGLHKIDISALKR